MSNLKQGFLSGITQEVIKDKDLDLQIRDNYLNIYYKGNSLLKLAESKDRTYIVEIHEKFLGSLQIKNLVDKKTTEEFINNIPAIKENIIEHGKSSLEIEYEQMIIRANNLESRNNTEYFIVDRQYAINRERIDLVGIYWDRSQRRKGQEATLCFMEIKFALNSDIKEVHKQLERYYKAIKPIAGDIAQENEVILRQKIDLGLFNQPENRLDAMKTLSISNDIDKFQFILMLVDYNPNSKQLNLDNLKNLPFSDQIKLFYSGFGMWKQNLIFLPNNDY